MKRTSRRNVDDFTAGNARALWRKKNVPSNTATILTRLSNLQTDEMESGGDKTGQ